MSIEDSSPHELPTIRKEVLSCGCVVIYDETGCCRHYDRDQTEYCAIYRSLRVPEPEPVAAPKPSRVSERLYEEAHWCRETGLHYTAALLTEAADLLENR